jgi:predicted nuclease of predicted toxin-antitoxin system
VRKPSSAPVNILADENADTPIVLALREDGHRVAYVRELEPGIDDRAVLQLANVDNALLLTSDMDFGELVFRQRLIHAGVILYRSASSSAHWPDMAIRCRTPFR